MAQPQLLAVTVMRGMIYGWIVGLVVAAIVTVALVAIFPLSDGFAFLLGTALGGGLTMYGGFKGEEIWEDR